MNNNQIQHTDNKYHFFIQSNAICKDFIKDLLQKTYENVGFQNTKRIAPKNVNNQALNILQGFTKISFTQKYRCERMLISQADPVAAQIDNFAVQQMENKRKPKTKQYLRIQSRQTDRKQSLLPRQAQAFDTTFHQLSGLPTNQLINDAQLNKLRTDYLNIQKQQINLKQQIEKKFQKDSQNRIKGQKIIKDMKKVTYDYEGKLFGQGTGITQPNKILALTNKYGQAKRTTLNNNHLDRTLIETNRKSQPRTDRKEFKQIPVFREKAESIIQNIQLSKGISQGVKIIEQMGDKKSITKQNPLKRSKMHSLAEFKNSQSKFKQYQTIKNSIGRNQTNSIQRSQMNSAYLLNTINNEQSSMRSKQSLLPLQKMKPKSSSLLGSQQKTMNQQESNLNTSFQSIQSKVHYKGLPFINSKGYRAIDYSSQKSFHINQFKKKQSLRHRITIKDVDLFNQTINLGE